MIIKIKPSKLNGTVIAPPSKSDAHRAIICAALSRGVCRVAPVAYSNDIKATIACIRALGARVECCESEVIVDGSGMFKVDKAVLDCGESGSTLRFLIPVAAAGGVNSEFIGRGRLPERPIGVYLDALPKAGVEMDTSGGLPLKLGGVLNPGVFELDGNISSQFISGLLFALPLLDGDSEIVLTSPLESVGYIDMTVLCMNRFGVSVERTARGWLVRGNQKYTPADYRIEGDWSQAAFFMTAAALSGEVTVQGVMKNSAQGDREISELLRRFGASVSQTNDSVTVKGSDLKATDIDARNIPDLVPILAVAASFSEGKTRIMNAERLRIKESDRLKTTAEMLSALGVSVEEKPDGLIIRGQSRLKSGLVQGYNDHRIVMAASVAALRADGGVTITDGESINKSYPNYFEEYKRLGGIEDVDLRQQS